ncbi:MAG TPA: hypothetical protein VH682_10990 [Gemmataceae bacterium]|jgi:hypothetical protein
MPWIMRATPALYDLAARLAVTDCWIIDWNVQPNVKGGQASIHIGDRVWFAILEATGTVGTIIGRGRILSEVVEAVSPERDMNLPFCPNRAQFPRGSRVFLEITGKVNPPFPLVNERHNTALQNMLIFRLTLGSMFWVSDEEAAELDRRIP